MRGDPKHYRPSGLLSNGPRYPHSRSWTRLPGSRWWTQLPGSRKPPLWAELHWPFSPLPPPHPSPAPSLPFTRASRPKKAHSRGIFTKWEHPEGKDFPTWLHVWLSGTSSLYFFHGDSSRDHQRQPAWGRCHCSPQALIRVMQPCAGWCLEASSLSPCHLSPKFRAGECIVPGFTLAWNTSP